MGSNLHGMSPSIDTERLPIRGRGEGWVVVIQLGRAHMSADSNGGYGAMAAMVQEKGPDGSRKLEVEKRRCSRCCASARGIASQSQRQLGWQSYACCRKQLGTRWVHLEHAPKHCGKT